MVTNLLLIVFSALTCDYTQGILWNGRKKIGMEYSTMSMSKCPSMEWKIWCMEWNKIFHVPYLRILTWCCWSPVFLSVQHISRQILSSTSRKLRAFFVISVTNSNVDAKRRSLILILFSWGHGTLLPDFCMFTSVLPACHCVRRDSYLASIARWFSPKPARSCHEKLLDPAKNHVTNFQLKSAKNSEILLKKLLFLRCLK